MNIEAEIRKIASDAVGREIPKPAETLPFRIKGMGTRRGEPALIYTIPSHTGRRPYEKGVTLSEFSKAVGVLMESGELTRRWFNATLQDCAKEGSCNFTSLGGVLQLLGVAAYGERGRYIRCA